MLVQFEPCGRSRNRPSMDDTVKHEEHCPCQNKGYVYLTKWYDNRCSSEPSAYQEYDETLDNREIEEKIRTLMPTTTVSRNCCVKCEDLLQNWPQISRETVRRLQSNRRPSYRRPHFSSILEFGASCRKQCHLCLLFAQCLAKRGFVFETLHKIQRRLDCLGRTSALFMWIKQYRSNSFSLTLTWAGHDLRTILFTDLLYVIPTNATLRKCNLHYFFTTKEYLGVLGLFAIGDPATPIVLQTQSTQLGLAKQWLNSCLNTHDSCSNSGKQPFQLPTRLLDVSSTNLRLVTTENWEVQPQYATLSHCWGKLAFANLRKELVQSFMTSIHPRYLTRTFRDAIEITQSLGLRYLWIDALCIVQNSNSDWERESATMSSVYSGSTVTIAASGAIDGNSGCFLKPKGYVGKVHFDAMSKDGNTSWDIAPSIYYDSVVHSHLAGRAWSVQETILSPRILYFSNPELFWGCKLRDAYESFPEGIPDILRPEKQGEPENWGRILRLYTQGKLTNSEDKLVAISGIAQAIQQRTHDEYFAGIWSKDIESQLCWMQEAPGRRPLRSMSRRAPTWSWASVDDKGSIYYNNTLDSGIQSKLFAHVVDAYVIPSGLDPLGKVSGGQLTISCTSILSGILCKEDPSLYQVEISSSEIFDVFTVNVDSDEDVGRTVYILPLIQEGGDLEAINGEKGHSYSLKYIQGLLLAPSNNEKGEYYRTGYVTFFDQYNFSPFQRFETALEAVGAATAEAGCAEILLEPRYPREKYIITII